MSWNRIPLVWHSPRHPFCHNHSPHPSLYSVNSSGCKSRVFGKTTVSVFSQLPVFFYNTIYIPFKFHFLSIFFIFSFAAPSSLLTNSPFQFPIFIQCYVSLSLGEKEETQLHTLRSLPKLYSRCIVTNHWQTERTAVIAHGLWCTCYLHSDLWTKELPQKFILYAFSHS